MTLYISAPWFSRYLLYSEPSVRGQAAAKAGTQASHAKAGFSELPAKCLVMAAFGLRGPCGLCEACCCCRLRAVVASARGNGAGRRAQAAAARRSRTAPDPKGEALHETYYWKSACHFALFLLVERVQGALLASLEEAWLLDALWDPFAGPVDIRGQWCVARRGQLTSGWSVGLAPSTPVVDTLVDGFVDRPRRAAPTPYSLPAPAVSERPAPQPSTLPRRATVWALPRQLATAPGRQAVRSPRVCIVLFLEEGLYSSL
ncbi:MAG: hypothetical protein BJ554DRAFT_476 [Olpidium bornovanus]|uniref:Uncharacterized protein n=1 Tax=Olpidium bornovanus TaxID=278681 RepID=A0A8H8DIJ2_9FUNG|nr:MAG: hypothetical protein BJ554DRAFT_476 [Olpidium bornovanus]